MISINIEGLDKLINKLDRVAAEGFELDNVVKKVENTAIDSLKSAASWAPVGSSHIGEIEIRHGERSYFIDVGLSSKKVPFESYKHLYYHNYGYKLYYMGRPTGKYISMHKMWFNSAVEGMKPIIEGMLKEEIKRQINAKLG